MHLELLFFSFLGLSTWMSPSQCMVYLLETERFLLVYTYQIPFNFPQSQHFTTKINELYQLSPPHETQDSTTKYTFIGKYQPEHVYI